MKSRAKQFRFSDEFKVTDVFGGSLCRKRAGRKARPISSRESMHVILKSSLAKGPLSLRAVDNRKKIDEIILAAAKKYGVQLIKHSNNFNHIHMLAKFYSREIYKRFIRSISGSIALLVTGASKKRSLFSILGRRNFWDARPYTRIVRGWRGFKVASDYVTLNQLEAEGVVPKRDDRLKGVKPSERRHFSGQSATIGCERGASPKFSQLEFFGFV